MKNKIVVFAVLAMAVSGIVTVGAISLNNVSSQNETETTITNETTTTTTPEAPPEEDTSVSTTTELAGAFANVKTTQSKDYIAILVTKNPDISQPPEPDTPITVIPGDGENGTIIVPDENATNGNVTVIEPDGNVTQVENGTVIDINNGTGVVVVPPEQNVTETPGNVTVVDPPVVPEPEPCACPQPGGGGDNQTGTGGNQTTGNGTGIPDVIVTPAPGQNVTVGENGTTEPTPPEPTDNQTTTEPEPTDNQTSTEPAPNGTEPIGDNQTVTDGGNQTNIENSTIEFQAFDLDKDWLQQIGLRPA